MNGKVTRTGYAGALLALSTAALLSGCATYPYEPAPYYYNNGPAYYHPADAYFIGGGVRPRPPRPLPPGYRPPPPDYRPVGRPPQGFQPPSRPVHGHLPSLPPGGFRGERGSHNAPPDRDAPGGRR